MKTETQITHFTVYRSGKVSTNISFINFYQEISLLENTMA
jgi:hypothetical protein